MGWLASRSELVVGVDIGKATTKLAEVQVARQSAVLLRVAMASTPPGAVEGGVLLDAPGVIETLRSLYRVNGMRARKAVVAVSGQNVTARLITMPAVPEEELRQAMKWEAERYVALPVDEAALDVQVVRDLVEEGQKRVQVLLAAAPERMVQAYMQAVEAMGLDVEAVEAGGLALVRVLGREATGGTVCLLNIGAGLTEVIIIRDGVPQIVRAIPMGSDHLTEAIARELGVDALRAERLKEEKGSTGLGRERSEDQVTREVARVVTEVLEDLVMAIRRSLDFYRAQFRDSGPARLVLFGGGSRLRNLAAHLAAELDLATELGDPGSALRLSSGEQRHVLERLGPQVAVAVGLALRDVSV